MTARPLLVELALAGRIAEIFRSNALPRFDETTSCNDTNADLFFSDQKLEIMQAKLICNSCPLIEQCRDWSIGNENHGVWGGMSERERYLARGGKDALETQETIQAREQFIDLFAKSISQLSNEYGVSERTIVRWRNSVTGMAA
jgi:WhiB family redox-sensing transcriptional regulator